MPTARPLTSRAKRDLVRALHLIITLPLGALVYAPTEIALELRPFLQVALFPLLAASGLWMWQGHRFTALFRRANERPRLSTP